MSFARRVTNYLGLAATEALQPANKTLAQKLRVLLSHMLKDGQITDADFRAMNSDVVYFVFNATEIRSGERAVAAGLNLTNLDLTRVDATETPERKQLQNTAFFYSSELGNPIDASLQLRAQDKWNTVWHNYLQLTGSQSGFHTLNQWLMHEADEPENIGVYWGNEQPSWNHSDDYVFVPEDTISRLNDWQKQGFLGNDKGSVLINESNDPALNEIKARFDLMVRPDGTKVNPDTIAFSIYHLTTSFGCWGGRAFYSIPLNFGSPEQHQLGILSICSKNPLNEDRLLRWSIVANKVFRTILLHEIHLWRTHEQNAKIGAAAYSVGHNLKNRVADGANIIRNVRMDLAEFKKLMTLDNGGRETIDEIRKRLQNVQVRVQSLANTGNLLDLMSRGLTSASPSLIFSEKDVWHETTDLDLTALIEDFSRSKSEFISKEGKYSNIILEPGDRAGIEPFILADRKAIRPATFVYEELILELLINAISYGHSYVDAGKKLVDVHIRLEAEDVIFRNTASGDFDDWGSSFEDLEVYSAKEIGHGGLRYLDDFLQLTQIGSLWFSLNKSTKDFSAIARLRRKGG